MSHDNLTFFEAYHRNNVSKVYAKRTYLHWIKFYIHLRHNQHPAQLGDQDVESFLSYLVNKRHVATQTQASA
jgi:hypothetical protein